jgi:hypothetical protein
MFGEVRVLWVVILYWRLKSTFWGRFAEVAARTRISTYERILSSKTQQFRFPVANIAVQTFKVCKART